MVQPFTSSWPLYPLPLRRTQNTQPAKAIIPQTLAGNAATLSGFVDGGDKIGEAPNTAPISPSGQRGHDHSGGEFGASPYVSIGTWSLGDFNSYDVGGNDIVSLQRYEAVTDDDGASITSVGLFPYGLLPVWIPPCDRRNGAYVKLGFYLYLDYVHDDGTGGMLAGDTVSVRIYDNHASKQFLADPVWTGAISSPETSELKLLTGTIEVVPASVNTIEFRLFAERDATAGNRAALVRLNSFELGTL